MPVLSRLSEEIISGIINNSSQSNLGEAFIEADVLIAGTGPVGYASQYKEASKRISLCPVPPMRVPSLMLSQTRM